MRKSVIIASLLVIELAACAANTPRIIQTSSNATEVRLVAGLATQIELPESDHVQSVVVGNSSMLSTDQSGNVVNLTAKGNPGETNIIIRSTDEDGHSQVYQYRILVQDH